MLIIMFHVSWKKLRTSLHFQSKILQVSGLLYLLAANMPLLHAQQDISVKAGEYEIFYSAFNTSFLSPSVAKAISVARAKNRGLINISIIKHGEGEFDIEPISAISIEGSAFNLIHRQPLVFKEVVEPNARYYLAPFKIDNDNELIVIDINVLPKGATKATSIKFQRRFFLN